MILMRVLHPWVSEMIGRIPTWLLPWLCLGILAIFIADTFVTVRSILVLKGKLDEIQRVVEEVRTRTESAASPAPGRVAGEGTGITCRISGKVGSIPIARGMSLREFAEERRKKAIAAMRNNAWFHHRLLKAFPNLTSARHADAFVKLKDHLKIAQRKKSQSSSDTEQKI